MKKYIILFILLSSIFAFALTYGNFSSTVNFTTNYVTGVTYGNFAPTVNFTVNKVAAFGNFSPSISFTVNNGGAVSTKQVDRFSDYQNKYKLLVTSRRKLRR